MTKFYVDEHGNYLGGFDGANPPVGAIEIDSPPIYGLDKLINGKWIPHKPDLAPLSAWQVRKVLGQFNLRSQVEAAVSQASQDVKDAWQFSNEFTRTNTVLLSMATALGISDAQLDEMFEIGITL